MDRTEHEMRLCFDPEYSTKYKELFEDRKILIELIKPYYRNNLVFWFLFIAMIVCSFIAIHEPAILVVSIFLAIVLISPIACSVTLFYLKKWSLGL